MNASQLKAHVEASGISPYFFDKNTMKFWGDTMANFGVRSSVVKSCFDLSGNFTVYEGAEIEVWELYRKRPVKNGLQSSAYFTKGSFQLIHVVA